MATKINELRTEIKAMQERAAVCNACMGSTQTMRDEGTVYLPQETLESTQAWQTRRDRSFFFPGFRKAVQTMTGKPFGQPIVMGDDTPTRIEACFENIDLAGRDLDTFCRDAFQQTLVDGLGWILVDYPQVPQTVNLAEEGRLGARPYLVHIPLEKMIGWSAEMVGGKPVLTHVRWSETAEIADGWGVTARNRIRVWKPGEVEVWVENNQGGWDLDPESSGPVSIKEIPIVALYSGRTGFWTADPPLEDLAWLNVAHWQSSSDQRHVLHVARVPFLGADEDVRQNPNAPVALGPDRLIVGLKGLRFVEHSGKAIEAGRQDLLDIEDQMRRLAGEMLSRQAGEKTAKEAGLEADEGASQLRKWVWTFQDAMEEVLRLMGAWIGEAQCGSMTIHTDWDDEALSVEMLTVLTSARQAGLVSQDTYLWNLQRGEFLPPGTDPEEEKAKLDLEGPQPMGPTT
jgi:hypothetical protein